MNKTNMTNMTNINKDKLSLTFAALGDSTRRAILERLSKGEASVSELAKPFMSEMSAPAITKHLKVLEKAGLISRGREAQWRPCKLNSEPIEAVHDWIETYRVFWELSFDRLDEHLKNVKGNIRKNKRKKMKITKHKKMKINKNTKNKTMKITKHTN